ncbi:Hsp70 family protein, partial [Escherichia coli]|uniref:Hsp70 family protein n=1 Tax=Escherichia coli TaxID=562 RepID=UPI0027397279
GTFDVSIIDSRFGNYDVQATDGIILGGDDFDTAIFRHICKGGELAVHHMNKNTIMSLKLKCAKWKIKMQQERKDFYIDLSAWG